MTRELRMKFQHGDLTIVLSRSADLGTVCWLGTSDSRDPGTFLTPIIQRVVSELKDCRVTVDFTQLQFMNSSTVPPVINLMRTLDANQIAALIVFRNDDWQRTHLRCMQAIARTFKHVRVEGRGRGLSAGEGSGPPERSRR